MTATYGIPGVEDHAFGLKQLSDALALRAHVLRQFERVAVDRSLVETGALTVVIGGGGPTGVELAGGLVELFDRVLSRDFPTLDVRRARVVLVEPADRLLGSFSPRLSERARATLAARGVEVVLGARRAGHRRQGGRAHRRASHPDRDPRVDRGIKASPLAQCLADQLGPEVLTRGGRVVVGPDLSLAEHPEVFVIGDLAGATGPDGQLLPQVAPVAIQAGAYVADTIQARLDGRATEPFEYVDKGSMATIGRHAAVAAAARWAPSERHARVVGLARAAPRDARGVPEPGERARELGVELPDLRPCVPADRRPGRTPPGAPTGPVVRRDGERSG